MEELTLFDRIAQYVASRNHAAMCHLYDLTPGACSCEIGKVLQLIQAAEQMHVDALAEIHPFHVLDHLRESGYGISIEDVYSMDDHDGKSIEWNVSICEIEFHAEHQSMPSRYVATKEWIGAGEKLVDTVNAALKEMMKDTDDEGEE